jgi:hypothetical protein
MGDHGKNYTVQEQLIIDMTERLEYGLKRINKSLIEIKRAIHAQSVVDKLVTLTEHRKLTAGVRQEDDWE